MLADGTGTGKTRQLLVTADKWAEISGRPSLLVTENRQIIEGNFRADADTLGIGLNSRSRIEVGTYDDLRSGRIGKGRYGLVLYDEAHNLKNVESEKTAAAEHVDAAHVLFSTATPMDRPTAASYFLSQITDQTELRVQQQLGYRIKEAKDADGNLRRVARLEPGMTWQKVLDNIVKMRDEAVSKGAMIRREFPFYGKIDEQEVALPAKALIEQKAINRFYDRKVAEAKAEEDPAAIRAMEGQRLLELSRWVEPYKLDSVWGDMQKDLARGRKVVIVAEGVNPTHLKGLHESEGQRHPAIIDELAKRLNKEKIPFARVYGAGSKSREVARFQSGRADVVLMTPKSGGAGIDLDDTEGDAPRSMYVVTPNFSGDLFEQILGRVSRRNTASPAFVRMLYAKGARSDERRRQIVGRKISALRAIQGGADPDRGRGLRPESGAKKAEATKRTRPARQTGARSGYGTKALEGLKITDYSDRSVLIGYTAEHKAAVKTAARELGLKIKLVKTPKGRGWLIPARYRGRFEEQFLRFTKSEGAMAAPFLLRKRL